MKKNLIIIVLALISFGFVNAQDSSTKRADKLFDRFEFVKAAEKYLELIEDDNETILKYVAKSSVTGKIAQLGSRLILNTAKKLSKTFFENFREYILKENKYGHS